MYSHYHIVLSMHTIAKNNCIIIPGLKENIKEVLTNLCQRQGISTMKKLAYLNAVVKLINENDTLSFGYSKDDLFCWYVRIFQ